MQRRIETNILYIFDLIVFIVLFCLKLLTLLYACYEAVLNCQCFRPTMVITTDTFISDKLKTAPFDVDIFRRYLHACFSWNSFQCYYGAPGTRYTLAVEVLKGAWNLEYLWTLGAESNLDPFPVWIASKSPEPGFSFITFSFAWIGRVVL